VLTYIYIHSTNVQLVLTYIYIHSTNVQLVLTYIYIYLHILSDQAQHTVRRFDNHSILPQNVKCSACKIYSVFLLVHIKYNYSYSISKDKILTLTTCEIIWLLW